MADYFDPKFGQVVALHFNVSNVDTAATNTDLTVPDGVGTLSVMPYAGSIVGLAIKANANVTAGTVAFNAHKESTEYSQVSSLLTTLTTASGSSNIGYSTVRPGVLTFAAGDGIGVSVSSATNLAATSIDYSATLWVLLNPI